MSNILITTINKPAATLTRAQVKQAIAELKSAAVHALSSVSKSAKKESFINTCTAIAVQRAVFGQDEIYRAIMDKARTLEEYKVTKSGTVSGTLGKLLHGYGEAVAVGKFLSAMYPMMQDECDMAPFAGDITFSALCKSLDVPTKGDATPPAKGDATPPAKGDATPPAKGDATPPAKGDATPPAKGDADITVQDLAFIPHAALNLAPWAEVKTLSSFTVPTFDQACFEINKENDERKIVALQQAESDRPFFIKSFEQVSKVDQDSARLMLADLAASLGYKLVKIPVKKAA